MRTVSLLALLALAACGSSEDLEDEVGGPLPPLVPATLASVGGMEELAVADMPTSGTARFEGAMEATLGAMNAQGTGGDRLTADLDMSVDFGDLSVTGTASDFESVGFGELDGTAAIAGGTVGNEMSAKVAGGLAGTDPETDEAFAATLDLDLDGSFVAEDPDNGPQGIRGGVSGDVAVPGEGTIEVTDGGFLAVRTE